MAGVTSGWGDRADLACQSTAACLTTPHRALLPQKHSLPQGKQHRQPRFHVRPCRSEEFISPCPCHPLGWSQDTLPPRPGQFPSNDCLDQSHSVKAALLHLPARAPFSSHAQCEGLSATACAQASSLWHLVPKCTSQQSLV